MFFFLSSICIFPRTRFLSALISPASSSSYPNHQNNHQLVWIFVLCEHNCATWTTLKHTFTFTHSLTHSHHTDIFRTVRWSCWAPPTTEVGVVLRDVHRTMRPLDTDSNDTPTIQNSLIFRTNSTAGPLAMTSLM